MSTARDLIGRAFRELRLIKAGNAMPEADYQDALNTLNSLLDSLSNNKSFSPYEYQESKALTGQTSFTIGPTGDLVSLRPVSIESATVDLNGITYPVAVYTAQQWDAIPNKTEVGTIPTAIYYEAVNTNGTVKIWPSGTGCTLKMRVINQVFTMATLSTVLAMPIGYEEMIVKNLAVNISPQYEEAVLSPVTVKEAKAAMTRIERNNTVVPKLSLDSRLPGLRGGYINHIMW